MIESDLQQTEAEKVLESEPVQELVHESVEEVEPAQSTSNLEG